MMDRSVVLEGYGVRLELLTERHLPELMQRCADPALWEYVYGANPFLTRESASTWLDEALAPRNSIPFAIVDAESGTVIGSTRIFDAEEPHRKFEIGWTFLAPQYWRTHVNAACKLLLLTYAFETWRANRVQFKAEAINRRSRTALEGIGATFEGVLRNFRIRGDGEIRDTSFYSIIPPEWPAVRAKLTARLTSRSRSNAGA